MKDKRVLLIDGDILVYECCTSVEYPLEWENDIWTLHSDLGEAKAKLDDMVNKYLEKLKADEVVFALSDTEKNFRKEVVPSYKSNRKSKRKPLVYHQLREYIKENYKTYERPGLEGDDILGILATSTKIVDAKDKIVCSIDKDMHTIPGLHVNLSKMNEGVYHVSEEDADRFHLKQTLMGDTVDGYTGVPGVGPKTADKILDKDCSWDAVVEQYEKKGLTEEDALAQARMAKILRASDYDFKKKEVILWEPN